ncbi:hypothetical protein RND71_000957 [Anisodus tanguticus]|uniref:Uncharacterized protein n=1 Tax=Anisodus tanguticus TaxID=243964 RepID=A0AAE1SZC6_9SOLA|nr:hypothetical protein RND71_000957 [Anisodus tanguticus]
MVTPEAKKKAVDAKARGEEAFKRKDFATAVDVIRSQNYLALRIWHATRRGRFRRMIILLWQCFVILSQKFFLVLGSENMTACNRKRKIPTDDHHILIDVKELEKDNKILRAAMLKKRYANVIIKSQQQILGEAFDGEEMKKKAMLWEKQLQEEKAKHQKNS